jgi:hypothetical protein
MKLLIGVRKSCLTPQIKADNNKLAQESWAASGPALPPDVRRWLRPAESSQTISGAVPLIRALPLRSYWAKGRTTGIAQNVKAVIRRGIATASHQAAKPDSNQEVTLRAELI